MRHVAWLLAGAFAGWVAYVVLRSVAAVSPVVAPPAPVALPPVVSDPVAPHRVSAVEDGMDRRVSDALARVGGASTPDAMTAAAQALADVSLDALREWVRHHQPEGHPLVRAAADVLAARLAADRPEAVAAWVLGEAWPGWRAEYASQAAHTLAGARAERALQLVPVMTNVVERRNVLGVAFAALAQQDPQRGRELALAASDEAVRREAVTTWLVNRADEDVAGAVALVNEAQLGDEDTRTCLAAVARAVAVRDGARAASWVDSLEADLRTAVMVNTVAGAWSLQDPGAAQRWLSGYADLVAAAAAEAPGPPPPERPY